MRPVPCSPEQQADCPLKACLQQDTHHLAYPSNTFKTPLEKTWRAQEFNKVQIPRCLHNAIHASGYKPEKPRHEIMAQEVWDGGQPLRSMVEMEFQLQLGQKIMKMDATPPEAA